MPSLSRGKESWVFYGFGFARTRNCDAALRNARSALHVVHVLCRLPLEAKRSNSTPSQGLPPQFAQGVSSEVRGTGAAHPDVRRAAGASARRRLRGRPPLRRPTRRGVELGPRAAFERRGRSPEGLPESPPRARSVPVPLARAAAGAP